MLFKTVLNQLHVRPANMELTSLALPPPAFHPSFLPSVLGSHPLLENLDGFLCFLTESLFLADMQTSPLSDRLLYRLINMWTHLSLTLGVSESHLIH